MTMEFFWIAAIFFLEFLNIQTNFVIFRDVCYASFIILHDVCCALHHISTKLFYKFAIFLFSSDMNFDQLSSELLQQQPLLSSQIIPDLIDEKLVVRKTIKSEPIAEKRTIPTPQQNVYKVVQSNASKSVAIKTTSLNSNVPPQKVQIVKKIPSNVVQQISDSRSNIKSNTVVNDNVATSSPIVINKVNGNISGKFG